MLSSIYTPFNDLMHRGGPTMWLLLAMSVVSVTLMFERCWFWLATSRQTRRVEMMTRMLRAGQRDALRQVVEGFDDVYTEVTRKLIGETYTDALALETIDQQRERLDRFMPTLSTMITAAPLVGLLGTVVGLINTFQFFGSQSMSTDPRSVGVGLAEALLNTAGGLIIAVGVIFPYNAFRAQTERAMTRMESLAAAAASLPPKNGPVTP